MATVLDLLTSCMDHLAIEQSRRALEVLKSDYVEFYLQLCRYNQRIESDNSEPYKEEELVLSEDNDLQLNKQKV